MEEARNHRRHLSRCQYSFPDRAAAWRSPANKLVNVLENGHQGPSRTRALGTAVFLLNNDLLSAENEWLRSSTLASPLALKNFGSRFGT